MVSKIILLKCVTNLHVGNGDVNYNIIDNEVERDPITNYPMINASGVKGALREFFHKDENLKGFEDSLFGNGDQQGKVKILAAEMLAIPVRASSGNRAYYMVTPQNAIKRANEQGELFLHRALINNQMVEKNSKSAEGISLEGKNVFAINLGQNEKDNTQVYELKDTEFRTISLPVVARNHLNNGISDNLWYEEFVPHESLFYFPVVADSDENVLNELTNAIDGKIIQFGGNATIGYGLCKVTVLQ